MYLVFTRRPGESFYRRLRSLLYLCDIFRALINSLDLILRERSGPRFVSDCKGFYWTAESSCHWHTVSRGNHGARRWTSIESSVASKDCLKESSSAHTLTIFCVLLLMLFFLLFEYQRFSCILCGSLWLKIKLLSFKIPAWRFCFRVLVDHIIANACLALASVLQLWLLYTLKIHRCGVHTNTFWKSTDVVYIQTHKRFKRTLFIEKNTRKGRLCFVPINSVLLSLLSVWITDVISDYTTFCEDMIIPKKTVKIYPNNKAWVSKSLKKQQQKTNKTKTKNNSQRKGDGF